MTNYIYLKILTGDVDPFKIIEELDILPDRVIKKHSQPENGKGVYKYNAIILNIDISDGFDEKSKNLIESINSLNIADLEINLNIEYRKDNPGTYFSVDFLKDLVDLNINIDIY